MSNILHSPPQSYVEQSQNGPYRGRFAPTPSGPLHLGSLVAALGSYLDARTHQGTWLLRIEDIDTPRTAPEATRAIIDILAACGFVWDEAPLVQSARYEIYSQALHYLQENSQVYPCRCSRKEIADSAISGRQAIDGGLIYPGTCRDKSMYNNKESLSENSHKPAAWRIRLNRESIVFEDAIQGLVEQTLASSVGDFIVKRADGIFSYQLAVVVDDAEQQITHVVRGADLLDSTARQIFLQTTLSLPTPAYAHLPVVTNTAGNKLSKQTLAPAIKPDEALPALITAALFLGHPPPASARRTRKEFWRWMVENWNLSRVPAKRTQTLTT